MKIATAITPKIAALVPLCTESAPRVGSTLISSTIIQGRLEQVKQGVGDGRGFLHGRKSPVIWPLLVICSCKTGADMADHRG